MMTHIIIQGPFILLPKDRIFYALKIIYFKLIFFRKKRTVYFPPGPFIFGRILYTVDAEYTVYSSPGPYILPRPYIFKDRVFYFSERYILLSYRSLYIIR